MTLTKHIRTNQALAGVSNTCLLVAINLEESYITNHDQMHGSNCGCDIARHRDRLYSYRLELAVRRRANERSNRHK